MYCVRDLHFNYRLGNVTFPALQGVDASVKRGEFVCLAGPSGSGKSTLLNLMGLIESSQKGSITIDGIDVGSLSEAEKNRIRRFDISFIFQNFHLIQVLNAEENVEYFLTRQGHPRAARKQKVREALEAVGLWEHRYKRPLEMSGGQRQRVAIARALAKSPKVLIADEPTASLDSATGRTVVGLIRSLCRERSTTVVVASHDAMVMEYADRVIHLVDGRITS